MPLYLSASNLMSLKSASRYIDSFHNLHPTDIQPKFYIILIAYVVRIYFVHLTKPGLVLLCLFCFRGGVCLGFFFLLYFVLFCLVLSYFALLALLQFFFLFCVLLVVFALLGCVVLCFVLFCKFFTLIHFSFLCLNCLQLQYFAQI